MGGFPVGRIKLRSDMLPFFPAAAAQAKAEPVRNEIKHRVDLMRVESHGGRSTDDPHPAGGILSAGTLDKPESQIGRLSEEELLPEIMVNSLHYDTSQLWKENLRRVDRMLQKAKLHRLQIGTSETEILKTVNQLW